MSTDSFPRMLRVRQKFPTSPMLDLRLEVRRELAAVQGQFKPRARIAVTAGSRGITNLQAILAAVLEVLKQAGTQPFIVPAMGSHGGATPEGQTQLLAEYGVTEQQLGVPIHASMATRQIGTTADGVPVHFSEEALHSDGIIVLNRVKPHTDFSGSIGSGLLKMAVVGLGKRTGATHFHAASSRLGYEHMLRAAARVTLGAVPILCGAAIIENQAHQTVRIAVVRPEEFERREAELCAEARRLLPRLPFDEIDLLIVDRIGKNISGTGMDPAVIGRSIHGYSLQHENGHRPTPFIHRVFVRDLTPQTHGNAIGIGMADFTTTRLVRAIDHRVMTLNSLTALSLQGAKIPIHFETDREVIEKALNSLALPVPANAKVVRIADTLSLESMEISESLAAGARQREDLELAGQPTEMSFGRDSNLAPMRS